MRMRRIRRRRAIAIALLPATMMIGAAGIGATQATGQDESAKATFQGKSKVRFGDRVKIRGEFPDSPNAEVAILQKRAEDSGYRRVAGSRTNANGNWSERVKPRVTGSWMAQIAEQPAEDVGVQAAADRESDSKRIRVRSVTKIAPSDRNATAGEAVRMRGRVKPGGQRRVKVQVGSKTMNTRTDRNGRFDTTWKAPGTGSYSVRASARGNKLASGSKDRGGTVNVFRSAQASWYGPGLYGNRTACGQTLSSSTKGVAHKSLPCGTKLTIRYKGRSVNTQVIDRGPYHGNREFDLTYATKKQLGFGDTGAILVNK